MLSCRCDRADPWLDRQPLREIEFDILSISKMYLDMFLALAAVYFA